MASPSNQYSADNLDRLRRRFMAINTQVRDKATNTKASIVAGTATTRDIVNYMNLLRLNENELVTEIEPSITALTSYMQSYWGVATDFEADYLTQKSEMQATKQMIVNNVPTAPTGEPLLETISGFEPVDKLLSDSFSAPQINAFTAQLDTLIATIE